MVIFVCCHLHQICKLSLWQIKRVITSLILYMLGLSKIIFYHQKFVKSYNYCYFFQILYSRMGSVRLQKRGNKANVNKRQGLKDIYCVEVLVYQREKNKGNKRQDKYNAN